MKQSYSSSKANHAPASCDNGSMEKTQSGWLSAEDLPTVQELRAGIALFEPLATLFNLDHDKYAEALETRDRLQKQLDEMVNLVDAFYDKLGSRHWIFTDLMSTDAVKKIITARTQKEAEKRIVAYYRKRETIPLAITHLHSQPAMRPRIPLIQLALKDYRAGRYYSTVLVLITVMDGFVNDCDPQNRKDQTARSGREMTGEDGVAALARGLPAAQDLFTKGFRKLDESEITEVYRNGILHGMLTNYNNIIVATKAWNMLFAVFDWKVSRDAKKEETKKLADAPTLFQLLEQINHNRENQEKSGVWKAHAIDLSHPGKDKSGAYQACIDFLTAWHEKNYGNLGCFLYNLPGYSIRKKAGEARELYKISALNSLKILKADRPAAAIATFDVHLECDSFQATKTLRFARVKARDDMNTAQEWEHGCWVLVNEYGNIPVPPIRRPSQEDPGSGKRSAK